MARQADFTGEEWGRLQQGVIGAALLVSLSDPGFFETFKEAGAVGRHFAEARRASTSELVRELAESRPGMQFGLGTSPVELESQTIEALRGAASVLRAKAPDEEDAYRQFVLAVAESVAGAAEDVDPRETGAIDKIRSALGEA